MADDGWRVRMESIVSSMVRPLVADGGCFEVVSADPAAKRLVVRASMGDCTDCAMSVGDLEQPLGEALRRNDPDALVSVTTGP